MSEEQLNSNLCPPPAKNKAEKSHKCFQDLYFNENNLHIYLLGARLIFYPIKINLQRVCAALPQRRSLQGFFSERFVLCECEL